jgi:putative FmdB family regulatory protein
MPMYEFDCVDCKKSFEELVLSGDPDVSCPACTSTHVSKRLSAFAVGAGAAESSSAPAATSSSCATGGCCSGGSCGW